MIEIIADSTCDMTQEELERYHVHLLPLHILLGDDEYRDGPGFDMQKMYAWADAHQSTPKTSAPSLEDMIALLEPILRVATKSSAADRSAALFVGKCDARRCRKSRRC